MARRLIDRLDDIQRSFPRALDLGCFEGHVHAAIVAAPALGGDDARGGVGGIRELVHADVSAEAWRGAPRSPALPAGQRSATPTRQLTR